MKKEGVVRGGWSGVQSHGAHLVRIAKSINRHVFDLTLTLLSYVFRPQESAWRPWPHVARSWPVSATLNGAKYLKVFKISRFLFSSMDVFVSPFL